MLINMFIVIYRRDTIPNFKRGGLDMIYSTASQWYAHFGIKKDVLVGAEKSEILADCTKCISVNCVYNKTIFDFTRGTMLQINCIFYKKGVSI